MKAINTRDFQRIVGFMRDTYGINLQNKRSLIDARLSFDITKRGYRDFSAYTDHVLANPEGDECRHMVNRLSTNYTYFFREPEYISQLCATVLPDFALRGKARIQLWCAACSSGQEAYSVAMALEHQRITSGGTFDFQITATDINTDMLQTAAAGIYDHAELEQIPVKYRRFTALHGEGAFEIVKELRDKIAWHDSNLLEGSRNGERYDIVFCRNVMIYFTPELRREMTKALLAAVRPDGYLFTGATESIDLERKYFRYIAPAFYRAIAAKR